jgi:hypothetical protein
MHALPCWLPPLSNVSRDRERTRSRTASLRFLSLSLLFRCSLLRTTGPRSADLLDVCAGVPHGQAFSLFSVFSQERAAPPTDAIHAIIRMLFAVAPRCYRAAYVKVITVQLCITVCSSYVHN